MRVTGLYFSGTGNSSWIAELIEDEVRKCGHLAHVYSIETTERKTIVNEFSNSDLIVFIYPGYGCDMPNIYKEYLLKLNGRLIINGTKAISIVTSGMYNADAALTIKPFCEKMGLDLFGTYEVKMPNNYHSSLPFVKVSNKKEIASLRLSAQKKTSEIVKNIISNSRVLESNNSFSKVIGITNRFLGSVLTKDADIFVIEKLCVSCGRCVNKCPSKNLHIAKENQPVYSLNRCTSCSRCVNNCPVQALRLSTQKYLKFIDQYEGITKTNRTSE